MIFNPTVSDIIKEDIMQAPPNSQEDVPDLSAMLHELSLSKTAVKSTPPPPQRLSPFLLARMKILAARAAAKTRSRVAGKMPAGYRAGSTARALLFAHGGQSRLALALSGSNNN